MTGENHMTAPIVSNDASASEFMALPSLEKQVAYMLVKLAVQENQYNNTNPNNTVERISITPNYDTNTFTYTGSFVLSPSAAQGTIVDGIQAYLPSV